MDPAGPRRSRRVAALGAAAAVLAAAAGPGAGAATAAGGTATPAVPTNGAFVDPGSPTAAEHEVPLAHARRLAAGITLRAADGVGIASPTSPAFGIGVDGAAVGGSSLQAGAPAVALPLPAATSSPGSSLGTTLLLTLAAAGAAGVLAGAARLLARRGRWTASMI